MKTTQTVEDNNAAIQKFWDEVIKEAGKDNYHSARARRRAMERAISKLSRKAGL